MQNVPQTSPSGNLIARYAQQACQRRQEVA